MKKNILSIVILMAISLAAYADSVTFTLPWTNATVTAENAHVVSDGSGSFSIYRQTGATTTSATYADSASYGTILAGTVTGGNAISQVATLHASGETDVSSYGYGCFLDINGATVIGQALGIMSAYWASGHSSCSSSLSSGDAMVQIRSGSVAYAFGAGNEGSKGKTAPGNTGVTITGADTLSCSAFGGWSASQGDAVVVNGNTAVKVLALQSITGTTTVGGLPVNAIVGGSAFQHKNNSRGTVKGNSSVEVSLAGETSGNFAKMLVGGSYLGTSGNTSPGTFSHEKNTSVSVTAPTTVTFAQAIVGGSYATASQTTTISGNSSVTINGGTYTGTITAGGVGDNSTVAGTATLTLKNGDFSGATLSAGNATGATTLEIYQSGTVTLPASASIRGFDSKVLVIDTTTDVSSESFDYSAYDAIKVADGAILTIAALQTDMLAKISSGAVAISGETLTISEDITTGATLSGTVAITINEGKTLTFTTTQTSTGLTFLSTGTVKFCAPYTISTVNADKVANAFAGFTGTLEIATGGEIDVTFSTDNISFPDTMTLKMSGGMFAYTAQKSLTLEGKVEIAEGTTSTISDSTGNFNVVGPLTGSGILVVSKGYQSGRCFYVKGETKDFTGTLTENTGGIYSFSNGKDVVHLGAWNTDVADKVDVKENSTIIVGSKENCALRVKTDNKKFMLVKEGAGTTLTLTKASNHTSSNGKRFTMANDSSIIVSNGTLAVTSEIGVSGVALTVCDNGTLSGTATFKSVTFEAGAKIDALPAEPDITKTYDVITTTVQPDVSLVKNAVVGGTGANNGNNGKGKWRVKVRDNGDSTWTLYIEYSRPGMMIVIS